MRAATAYALLRRRQIHAAMPLLFMMLPLRVMRQRQTAPRAEIRAQPLICFQRATPLLTLMPLLLRDASTRRAVMAPMIRKRAKRSHQFTIRH